MRYREIGDIPAQNESRENTRFSPRIPIGKTVINPEGQALLDKLVGRGITTKFIRVATEYEGRLFGGAYGPWKVQIGKRNKDAGYRIVLQARFIYNALRKEAGLPEVTNWNERPKELIRDMPVEKESQQ